MNTWKQRQAAFRFRLERELAKAEEQNDNVLCVVLANVALWFSQTVEGKRLSRNTLREIQLLERSLYMLTAVEKKQCAKS